MGAVALGLIFVFILAAGGLRSVEVGCQNTQKFHLKNMWLCAVVSYAVALAGFSVFLVISTVVSHSPWPTWADVEQMPWWAPFGGLIGGVAVLGMITVAKYVGVATFNAVVIVAEMLVALVMDDVGAMGFAERHATPPRLLAAALIAVAAYLMAGDARAAEPRPPEFVPAREAAR